MNHTPSSRLALLLCLSVLTGCATYRSATVVQDGPGLSFNPDEIASFRQNQDKGVRLRLLASPAQR